MRWSEMRVIRGSRGGAETRRGSRTEPKTRHASEGWHPSRLAYLRNARKRPQREMDPSLRWGDELGLSLVFAMPLPHLVPRFVDG